MYAVPSNVPRQLTTEEAHTELGRHNGTIYGYGRLHRPIPGDDAIGGGMGVEFNWASLEPGAEALRGQPGWQGNTWHTVWDKFVIEAMERRFGAHQRFRWYKFVPPAIHLVPGYVQAPLEWCGQGGTIEGFLRTMWQEAGIVTPDPVIGSDMNDTMERWRVFLDPLGLQCRVMFHEHCSPTTGEYFYTGVLNVFPFTGKRRRSQQK
jgi:hypothetical protein